MTPKGTMDDLSIAPTRTAAATSTPALWMAAPVAALYGVVATWVFRLQSDDVWAPMSLCFLFVLPFVVGVLTVLLAPRRFKLDMSYGILAPLVATTLLGAIPLFLAWEVIICVAMAMPLLWGLGAAGGALTVLFFRRRAPKEDNTNSIAGLLLLLPYLLAPVEAAIPLPDSIRTVETVAVVQASPEEVWNTILTVPEIQPEEQRSSLFQWLGLPQPVEAMLEGEGVGAVRRARYDNGLRLLEPVTVWEPGRRYAFQVKLDPSHTPPTPFGAIGGRHFDVQEVGFELEPLLDGATRLHLQSTHRLSTHFNFYGGPWSDFLMGDFQGYILEILKERAER